MENYREQNLMNANEIRTMQSEEVLIVSGNAQPVLIPSKGYFEVWRMKRATNTTRYPPVPVEAGGQRAMEWVGL
jgi:type IV secretory pathway TraG/TraD family ATPase VirD4